MYMDNVANKVHFKVAGRAKPDTDIVGKVWLIRVGNALLLILSVFLIYNIYKSVDLTIKKVAILKQAEQEVDGLRLKNISLILSREKVETDDYIETEARDRLNLSKDEEIVFVIPDEALYMGAEIVQEALSPVVSTNTSPPYSQWLSFLTSSL